MIFQENYKDRIGEDSVVELNEDELEEVKNHFQLKYSICDGHYNDSVKFYSYLHAALPICKQVGSDKGFIQYLDFVEISQVDLEEFVYIIWETPNQITKIKIRDLNRQWYDVWCPPADDGLIILTSCKICFMITDYGMIHYD